MMPLLDHFRPPLSLQRGWHSFHNAWASNIAAELNQRLPEEYFAAGNVQFGIQIDVATFEDPVPLTSGASVEGGVATAPARVWTAPPPTRTIPLAVQVDIVEVLLFREEGGAILTGAIELVSPANKDRPAHRDAFVSKCASYLQQGVGLILIDLVTGRAADLHQALLARLGAPEPISIGAELYSVSYRPVRRDEETELNMWEERLTLGHSLPTLPLWLRGGLCVPVDLEPTYIQTCRGLRIPL